MQPYTIDCSTSKPVATFSYITLDKLSSSDPRVLLGETEDLRGCREEAALEEGSPWKLEDFPRTQERWSVG